MVLISVIFIGLAILAAPIESITVTHRQPNEQPTNPGQPLSNSPFCPDGWVGRADNSACYLFTGKYSSMEAAEEFCDNNGGHLVSIHSTNELGFVGNLAKDKDQATIWIGLEKMNNSYTWTDNSHVNYLSTWAPSFIEGPCVVMYPDNLDWDHSPCELDAGSYVGVCKKTMVCPDQKATGGWRGRTNSPDCYFPAADQMAWQTVQNKCKETGSSLVKILDAAENNFVRQIFMSGENPWIGLKIVFGPTGPRYQWPDGTFLDLKKDFSKFIKGRGRGRCIIIDSNGYWKSEACSHYEVTEERGGICKMTISNYS